MSAYKGYLLKIGNWVVPNKFIRAQTYTVLRSGQDLDSYRDADGNLHRTALDNFLYKVEFETPPLQTDSFYEELWGNIKNQYVSTTEKKGIDGVLCNRNRWICNTVCVYPGRYANHI